MIEWAGTRITDGTERADRVVAALQSDYFHVDELLFTDLLAMAAELAANIRFYDLKNAVSGSWSELFTADEAVIMAMILSVDLKHAEAEFSQCCPGSTQNLGRYVLGWLKRINFWISKLNKLESRSAVQLRQKLNMLVREKLASELYAICSILEHLQQDSGSELDSILAEFVPIWGIVQQGESYRYPRLGQDELGQEQHKPRLHRAFYTLHNAIAYLRTLVPSYLRESLSSQRHAPAIGLFMAFLKLYERAQQQINQFSRRHLHFYYHGVLKAEPRDQRAESVYLCFAAKPGTDGALIKRATRFTAGKDQALKDIVYRTDSDLLVTDARIVSLYTLLLQHDRLISPEAQLGFVTRIKTITPPIPEMGAEQASLSSWPLFGGDTREIGSQDAKIGFAVASPLLLLREGERRIELNLWLQDSSSRDAGSLIQGLSKAVDREAFLHGCGKLFSRYLLRGAGWLNHEQRQRLTQMLSSFLDEASAKTIKGLFEEDREWLFYKLMRNAFSLQLTIAEGWQEIADFVVTPLSDPDTTDQVGIKIIFVLEQEISPTSPWTAAVHGDRFDTEHPVLRCRINPRSNFYPYSLIQDFVIDKLEIQVAVKGLKTILAYNNHGQLDPSKPFQPFGPLPTCNSYLVIGNYEIATKRLSDLKLNLEWGELPIAEGGLGDYYRHYPGDYRNASFKGRFEALVDGQWRDREGEKARTVRLFSDACPVTGGRQQRRLDVNLCDDLKPADRSLRETAFGYGLRTRNGFFRLALAEPETAFGHTLYPELLTQSLMKNVRLKKPQETPNQPYTPIINRLSLDYRAAVELRPSEGLSGTGDPASGALYHIHPFGVELLDSRSTDGPLHLFPQYSCQGNLFLGIDGETLSGTLTLLFHLAEDLGQERSRENPIIDWFYLTEQGWRRLPPARVHADTTEGFLTTGLVTLDLPADMVKGGGIMPGNLYWLRISADKDLQGFSRCYRIRSHAVKLTRDLSVPYSLASQPPEHAKWQPMVTLPGVDRLWQTGRVITGRPAETGEELITRLSERLRHKNRAVTPWDYERLILERFPQVAKVKCFTHMQSGDESNRGPRPGSVLIVVVPRWQTLMAKTCDELMLSAVDLTRMKDFLQRHSSRFVHIEVRNPVYEQVQVRCSVKFTGGFQAGYFVNRLDRDISGYICPWQAGGYHPRFGWRIRKKDIESYLQKLDYVEFITNFSLLHITRDDEGRYSLGDTARHRSDPEVQIEPRFPWSLVLPAGHHFIETIPSAKTIEPEVTGIDELEVGTNFIITGNSGNG